MTKCLGCGALLQNNNIDGIGYTNNINNKLCMRCFKIKNYNEYKKVNKTNEDYRKILKNIAKTNDLVVLVVDIFDIPANLEEIRKIIKNDLLLVVNKRDILPVSINPEKINNYFSKLNLNYKDLVIVSSKNNLNFDQLFNTINTYKISKNVYIVGFTNAGKSSIINKLIYNYSNNKSDIMVSNMPSTTIDVIEIELNDNLKLIDTPGLLNEESIINKIDGIELKHIIPKSRIKPRIYQIKKSQAIYVEDYAIINITSENDLIFYFANDIKIERKYNQIGDIKDFQRKILDVKADNDIVLVGLGFIKIKKSGKINIYTRKDLSTYVRNSLI